MILIGRHHQLRSAEMSEWVNGSISISMAISDPSLRTYHTGCSEGTSGTTLRRFQITKYSLLRTNIQGTKFMTPPWDLIPFKQKKLAEAGAGILSQGQKEISSERYEFAMTLNIYKQWGLSKPSDRLVRSSCLSLWWSAFIRVFLTTCAKIADTQ